MGRSGVTPISLPLHPTGNLSWIDAVPNSGIMTRSVAEPNFFPLPKRQSVLAVDRGDGVILLSATAAPSIGGEAMTNIITNISHEAVRVYNFGNGNEVEIEFPLMVEVSDSGHHYVIAKDGFGTIVAPGWIGLEIQPIACS